MARTKSEVLERVEAAMRELAEAAAELKAAGVSDEEREKMVGRVLDDLERLFPHG